MNIEPEVPSVQLVAQPEDLEELAGAGAFREQLWGPGAGSEPGLAGLGEELVGTGRPLGLSAPHGMEPGPGGSTLSLVPDSYAGSLARGMDSGSFP